MNLYLSSYMIGDHANLLREMAGGCGARMAIIINALDGIAIEAQLDFVRNRFDPDEYFEAYGFDPSLIDLPRYVGRQEALRALLQRQRVIWSFPDAVEHICEPRLRVNAVWSIFMMGGIVGDSRSFSAGRLKEMECEIVRSIAKPVIVRHGQSAGNVARDSAQKIGARACCRPSSSNGSKLLSLRASRKV